MSRVLVLSSLFFFSFQEPAHADWGCDTRPLTGAESGKVKANYAAIAAALPQAPKGWDAEEDAGPNSAQPGVCKNGREPYRYSLIRHFNRVEGVQARQQKIIEASAGLTSPDMQARMAAFDKRQQALLAQLQAATAKQDMAAVTRLAEQVEKLEDERAKALNAGGTLDKTEAAAAEASKDTSITVGVDVNRVEYSFNGQAMPVKIAGADAAYLSSDADEAAIFLGSWGPVQGRSLRVQMDHSKAQPQSPAQSMVVYIKADKSRLAALMKQVDLAKLRLLLAR